MKALEVIEQYGLDHSAGVDAIMKFWDSRFICEKLCEVLDDVESTEKFAEFVDNYLRLCDHPNHIADKQQRDEEGCSDQPCYESSGIMSDDEFLRQLEAMETEPHDVIFEANRSSIINYEHDRLAFWKWKAAVIQRIFEHPAMQDAATPTVVPDFDGTQWDEDFQGGMTVDEAVAKGEATFNRGGW